VVAVNVGESSYFGVRDSNLDYYGWIEIERVADSDWRILGVAVNTEGEFTLGTVIPEPSSIILAFILGSAALLGLRKRGQQAA